MYLLLNLMRCHKPIIVRRRNAMFHRSMRRLLRRGCILIRNLHASIINNSSIRFCYFSNSSNVSWNRIGNGRYGSCSSFSSWSCSLATVQGRHYPMAIPREKQFHTMSLRHTIQPLQKLSQLRRVHSFV